MRQYPIKSFRGGIAPFDEKGQEGSFKLGVNLDIRRRTDSLKCTYAFEELPNVTFDSLVSFIVPTDNEGAIYFLTSNGKIYEMTIDADAELVYTDPDGYCRGAEEWYDNTGNKYLYWATDTNIKRKILPGLSDWSDTTTVGTVQDVNYHTMKRVAGKLLICNGQYLAQVGYDGSFTDNALDLFPYIETITLLERKRYVVIGCGRQDLREEAPIFTWDLQSDGWNDIVTLAENNVNALIDGERPLANIGNGGSIALSDMNSKIPIASFPYGGTVLPDAVCLNGGLTLFGVSQPFGSPPVPVVGVYSYGRKYPDHPFSLNLEYQVDADTIGSVCKANSELYVSYKDETTGPTLYGVKKLSSNYATAYYFSLDFIPEEEFQKLGIFKGIVVDMLPLPSGCYIEAWYKLDKTGEWVQGYMEGGSTQFSTEGAQEGVFLFSEKVRRFEFYVKLVPFETTTPEVLSINLLVE